MAAPDLLCCSTPVEYHSISLWHILIPDQLHTVFWIQTWCVSIADLRFRQTHRTLTTSFQQYLKTSPLTSPLIFLVCSYKVQWEKFAFPWNTGISKGFCVILGLQFFGEHISHLLSEQITIYRQKKGFSWSFDILISDLRCDNKSKKPHLNISILGRFLSKVLKWSSGKQYKIPSKSIGGITICLILHTSFWRNKIAYL